TCAAACAMCRASPKIEKGKDEHPHQIDEVPVQAHDFDVLVVPLSAGEKASRLAVEISTQHFSRNDDQKDHSNRHMGAMEARDHEKTGPKLVRAPRVAPRPHPFHDQLGPLKPCIPTNVAPNAAVTSINAALLTRSW